jgi:hypothetical protein
MSKKERVEPEDRNEYSVQEKANEEGNKLFYDTFKHLTTLSTGSILILVALLEKLFTNPRWKFLVIIALVSFIVSIITSILSMFFVAGAITDVALSTEKRAEDIVAFVSTIAFLLGIISFVVFAIKNFYI